MEVWTGSHEESWIAHASLCIKLHVITPQALHHASCFTPQALRFQLFQPFEVFNLDPRLSRAMRE